jgi:hypothetical protein
MKIMHTVTLAFASLTVLGTISSRTAVAQTPAPGAARAVPRKRACRPLPLLPRLIRTLPN